MIAPRPSHECPATGCLARVSPDMLMCRPHWFMVPAPMREAVWSAYRGPGPGSEAHRAAILAAIGAVNDRIARRAELRRSES